jgi:hypothetical protein
MLGGVMTSDTATGSAHRIHDPGAKQILFLMVKAGPTLKTHTKALAAATNVQQGSKPQPGGPKANTPGVARALTGMHADVHALSTKIKRISCHTHAGRRGKAQMLQYLSALDQATGAWSKALAAADRPTKTARMTDTQRFVAKAKKAAAAARPLLQR